MPTAFNMNAGLIGEHRTAVIVARGGFGQCRQGINGRERSGHLLQCVITSYSIHYTKLYESAQERALSREKALYDGILDVLADDIPALQQVARALATIDVV